MTATFKDKILLAKLKSRDKDAFLEAYDLYVDKLYRFIFYKVNNAEDAQDLTSVVFLKAWDHVQQNNLKNFKTLPALFYKIARNAVIDHYRNRANRVEKISLDDPENPVDLPDDNQDLEGRFALAADLATVHEKLAQLKDEYREVIVLRYIDELSISEMADILEKNNGNVRIMIFRALNALRELLSEENK